MSRVKRTVDYISALYASKDEGKSFLGEELKQKYVKWLNSLAFTDFLQFIDMVKENQSRIGPPQFTGRFRAYAFEEYIYRLIAARVHIPPPLQLFWGEKCLVWREGENNYTMEFDVSIGRKLEGFIEPRIVFEAKVELDSARLKAALASFAMLRRWNKSVKCLLIYLIRDADLALLKLAKHWADGIFHFSAEENASNRFFQLINNLLSEC